MIPNIINMYDIFDSVVIQGLNIIIHHTGTFKKRFCQMFTAQAEDYVSVK